MSDNSKSVEKVDKIVKTPESPVQGRRNKNSKEIGFIVRREHRRKHREDREF